MKLKNKVCYVAGGTGKVGKGIVREFLNEEAYVIISSRFKEKLENLEKIFSNEKLFFICENIGSEEGAEKIKNYILDRFNEIDVVVASIGSWWSGKKNYRFRFKNLRRSNVSKTNNTFEIMLTKVLYEELNNIRINEVLLPPVGQKITENDIGKFLAYLCSDEAYMINGQIISLYGD